VTADPGTTMAGDSAAIFSRDWRFVALIACVCFPASFTLYHYVVPLGAWVAAAPELLVSAIGAGLTSLLAMLAAAIGITRRMHVDNRRMRVAINNMSQGLCMFDRNERLEVCNRRYMELYQLPDEVVTPGRTLASISTGSFSRDPDEYRQGLVAAMAQGKTTTAEVKSESGRVVSVVNRPMADGGWVVTHEDITERRSAERECASM
jgi:PAS domain-containing protein